MHQPDDYVQTTEKADGRKKGRRASRTDISAGCLLWAPSILDAPRKACVLQGAFAGERGRRDAGSANRPERDGTTGPTGSIEPAYTWMWYVAHSGVPEGGQPEAGPRTGRRRESLGSRSAARCDPG